MKRFLAKLGLIACALGCAGLLTAVGSEALHTWREQKAVEENAQLLKHRLEQLQQEKTQKTAYRERYFNDPAFFESIVREKLGYVKANEEVYYFGVAQP